MQAKATAFKLIMHRYHGLFKTFRIKSSNKITQATELSGTIWSTPCTQQSSSKQNWSEQALRFNTQWGLTPWGKWKVMWECIDCFVRAEILQILCNGCHVHFASSVRMTFWRPDCEISSPVRLTEIYHQVGKKTRAKSETRMVNFEQDTNTDSTSGLSPTDSNIMIKKTWRYSTLHKSSRHAEA